MHKDTQERITIHMIARESAALLGELVEHAAETKETDNRVKCAYNVTWYNDPNDPEQDRMSLSEFSDRILAPCVHALAERIGRGRVVFYELPLMPARECATASSGGASCRVSSILYTDSDGLPRNIHRIDILVGVA